MLARLLDPFDGPGICRAKKLVEAALRSLGEGSRRQAAHHTVHQLVW